MVIDSSNSSQTKDNEGQPSNASFIPFTEEKPKAITTLLQQSSNTASPQIQ